MRAQLGKRASNSGEGLSISTFAGQLAVAVGGEASIPGPGRVPITIREVCPLIDNRLVSNPAAQLARG